MLTDGAPVLADVVVFAGMIIALCHISGICPVEIARLKTLLR